MFLQHLKDNNGELTRLGIFALVMGSFTVSLVLTVAILVIVLGID